MFCRDFIDRIYHVHAKDVKLNFDRRNGDRRGNGERRPYNNDRRSYNGERRPYNNNNTEGGNR